MVPFAAFHFHPHSSILGIRGDSGVKAGTEQYGLLAQTAEQLAVNQRVGGSIPSQSAIQNRSEFWGRGTDGEEVDKAEEKRRHND